MTIDEKLLEYFSASGRVDLLNGILRGIEKESLRVCHDGLISQTEHPKALGSALTHQYITTDFSEAQLELVTPPYKQSKNAMHFLDDMHHFTSLKIGQEIIWPFSMPLDIDSDEDIFIASYGKSNLAKFKKIIFTETSIKELEKRY